MSVLFEVLFLGYVFTLLIHSRLGVAKREKLKFINVANVDINVSLHVIDVNFYDPSCEDIGRCKVFNFFFNFLKKF